MYFKDKNYWAVILGGSSGFGLATAKKLAKEGMNILVVHRDRRGSMEQIEQEFCQIKDQPVKFKSLNMNALDNKGIEKICTELKNEMATNGKVRVLMHSIAFGNLKLIAPQQNKQPTTGSLEKLAKKLSIPTDSLKSAINQLFNDGESVFSDIAESTKYNNERFINDEDMSNTIYSMGSSLLTYVQKLFHYGLFASDARIFGMTSEGNEVAWRGYAAVSAAKVVLESVMRSISVEFAPWGIRANIIQAGVTETPALRLIPGSKQLVASAKKRNPCGRLTLPADIANAICMLSTDEASWINGDIIRVDGGERIAGF